MKLMTLEEKIGQMVLYSSDGMFASALTANDVKSLFDKKI